MALIDDREIAILRRTLGSKSQTGRAYERCFEFGSLVSQLLSEYPDVDLPTIRLSEYDDPAIVQVTGRRGPLIPVAAVAPGCSTCHQAAGRPHTDYCHAEGIVGADPRSDIDRFAIAPDPIPATAGQYIAERATEWVDDGCRCPSPTNHDPACPTQPHPYTEAVDDNGDPMPGICDRCGRGPDEPRHMQADQPPTDLVAAVSDAIEQARTQQRCVVDGIPCQRPNCRC